MGHTGAASAIRLPHVGHRTIALRAVYDAWCRRRTHLLEATRLLTTVSSTGAHQSLMSAGVPSDGARGAIPRPRSGCSPSPCLVAREPTSLSAGLQAQPHPGASIPDRTGLLAEFMLARLLLLNQVIARSAAASCEAERVHPTTCRARPAGKGDQMDVLGKNPLRVGLTVAICLGAIVGLVGCDGRTAGLGGGHRPDVAEAAPVDRAPGVAAPSLDSAFGRSFPAGDIVSLR